jgi:hypothetical protein
MTWLSRSWPPAELSSTVAFMTPTKSLGGPTNVFCTRGGLDGKVPQQNPELRTPHEAASAPAPRLFVKPEFNRPWSIQLRRKVDDLSQRPHSEMAWHLK